MELSKQQILLVLMISVITLVVSWYMVVKNKQEAVVEPRRERFKNSETISQKKRANDIDYEPLNEHYSVRQKGVRKKLEPVEL